MNNSIFEDLFVLDMANNHQGSVAHGLTIIDQTADVVNRHNVNATVKLQYRQLDSFIHPDFAERNDVPHIPRFLSTRLSNENLRCFVDRVKENGLKTLVTPFDEDSVDVCLEHNVEMLKVASCSANDWPLLEVIAKAGKPTIISTGGLQLDAIDNLVSFFSHRECEFALMHCVSIYPTPNELLNMAFVKRLIKRYPNITVGYSGHEAPENLEAVKVAVSVGAKMFERHVGVSTDTISLNKYSMDPTQVDEWIQAYKQTKAILGDDRKQSVTDDEKESIGSLQRGVYLKRSVKRGDRISNKDVFFAMPCQPGQLTSGEFGGCRSRYVASHDYAENDAVREGAKQDTMVSLRSFVHEAKGMLHEAGIHLGNDFEIELSHHYGLEEFRKTGALIVTLVNREYCKKIIVLLAGQSHPKHRHVQKEETFQLLAGDLELKTNDVSQMLEPGDKVLIERGTWHSFSTESGAIFEEVSTKHIIGDSYYEDEVIAELDPIQRKTLIETW